MLAVGVGPEEEQARQLIASLGAFWFVHESCHFQAIKALVLHELGPHELIRITQQWMLMVRDLPRRSSIGRHCPYVSRHCRVRVVEQDLIAFWNPHVVSTGLSRCRRTAVDSTALGKLYDSATIGGNLEDVVLIVEILSECDPLPIRRPSWLAVFDRFRE